MSLEETFTDKEVCAKLKIDRATSLRWREQGIIGHIKTPNGAVRYLSHHIEEFIEKYEKKAGGSSRQVQGGRLHSVR